MFVGIIPSLWLTRKEPTSEGREDPQETPLHINPNAAKLSEGSVCTEIKG